MTSPAALVIPDARPSIEQERDAWRAEDATLNESRRTQALSLYRLYLRWSMLYPTASLREYVTWLGYGVYTARFYSYAYGGFALDRGFTEPAYRLGDLHQIGQALMVDGNTVQDVRARLAAGQPARLSCKTTIPMSVPADERPAMQEAVERVSSSDKLPAPEAHARIFRAWEAAGPVFQDALLHAEATGSNPLDALMKAVDDRRDYRSELKKQGCCVCGVVAGVELHHVRLEADERYRTHNHLLPLCQRHHGARPGDSADSIHARTLESVKADAQLAWAAFRAVSIAAEASRPEKENA
jgi:hypothetical protein